MNSSDDNLGPKDLNSIEDFKIRSLDAEVAISWISASWRISKKHFGIVISIIMVMVVCSLFAGIGNLLFPKASYVIAILSLFIMGGLNAGNLFVISKCVKNENPKFSDLFYAFRTPKNYLRIAPYIFLTLISAALQALFILLFGEKLGETVVTIISLFFSVGILFLIKFVLPLLIFKKIKFNQAIKYSILGLFKNIIPLIFSDVLFLLLFLACLLVLLLPVLFVWTPILFCWSYIAYATIYENLEPDRIAIPPGDIES